MALAPLLAPQDVLRFASGRFNTDRTFGGGRLNPADRPERDARDRREQLAKELSDLAGLRTEIAASRTGETQALARLRETELALDRVSSEAAQLRRVRRDETANLGAQQARIRELDDQVATYSALTRTRT